MQVVFETNLAEPLPRACQRSMQLIDMGGDHIAHHRPGLRRWRSAAQTWVEPDKFRSPAGQNEPKYAGKQPKLDHSPARGILVSATHRADWPASLPIFSHAPNRVPIQMLRVAGMCSETVGQRLPDIPMRRRFRWW